ncbi:hypothetical protein R8Z50_24735 [Longispora sp. K20-0274]
MVLWSAAWSGYRELIADFVRTGVRTDLGDGVLARRLDHWIRASAGTGRD